MYINKCKNFLKLKLITTTIIIRNLKIQASKKINVGEIRANNEGKYAMILYK
jgi:hypothetical protein